MSLIGKIITSRKFFLVRFWILVFASLFTISCKKQTAQYPSNKVVITDSSSFILEKYNKDVASKEDSLLQDFVSKQTDSYLKSDVGFWYFIEKSTKYPLLTEESAASFDYKIISLAGEVIGEEKNKTVHFGKKEVMPGIEEGLKLMHKGEIAKFVLPSYLTEKPQSSADSKIVYPVILYIESH